MSSGATSVHFATANPAATQAIGHALAPIVSAGDVIVLTGDLGAGKTQFTKGLAAGLGVAEGVTSPTFNLLLVHDGRIPLYHFDLYRLRTADELEDLDYWGTLESDGVSVGEWGDRFAEALPGVCLVVRLRVTGDEARDLEAEPHGERYAEMIRLLARSVSGLAGVRVLGDGGIPAEESVR